MLKLGINSFGCRRAPDPPAFSRVALVALTLVWATSTLACTSDNGDTPTTAHTTGATADEGTVRAGLWGGDGIILRVIETGATVEYECAAGTITEPLRPDREGHFEAKGLHSNAFGGPIEATPASKPKPLRARYTGSIDGSRMTLDVALTKTGEQLGRFELTYEHEPHLARCH